MPKCPSNLVVNTIATHSMSTANRLADPALTAERGRRAVSAMHKETPGGLGFRV